MMMMMMMMTSCCSYDEFCDQQSSIATGYPESVQTELKSYTKDITSYFAVKRRLDQTVSISATCLLLRFRGSGVKYCDWRVCMFVCLYGRQTTLFGRDRQVAAPGGATFAVSDCI